MGLLNWPTSVQKTNSGYTNARFRAVELNPLCPNCARANRRCSILCGFVREKAATAPEQGFDLTGGPVYLALSEGSALSN